MTKPKDTFYPQAPAYPPTPAAALDLLEKKLGAPLPPILRACYMQSNGGTFGDPRRHSSEWHLHPIFDTSDKKRRKKTAEDILHFTRVALRRVDFPRNGISIAHDSLRERQLFIKCDALTGKIRDEIFLLDEFKYEWGWDWNVPFPEANLYATDLKAAIDQRHAAMLVPANKRVLPIFRYYANPFVSGVFEKFRASCACCGKSTGYIYRGGFYCDEDELHFCPWCIADGSAAAKFEGEFNDLSFIDEKGVSREVVSEVAERTPGFISFQQGPWLAHCGDACQFLGDIGDIDKSLLETEAAQDFIQPIREEMRLQDDESWNKVLCTTTRERDLSIFIFVCLHCGTLSGYPDYP